MRYLLQHFLEYTAEKFSDKTALVFEKNRFTFRQIEEKANQLANCLIRYGIKRGDRVAVFMDNSAEAIISLFGILKADAVFSILSSTIKSQKLQFILNNSEAKILITHKNKYRFLQPIVNNLTSLQHIIIAGPKEKNGAFSSSVWDEVIHGNMVTRPATKNIGLDLASIIYTSGSTGEPKGVMLTHCNMISAAKSITTYLQNNDQDIILSTLPLSFDYGLYQVLMTSFFGGTLVLERSFLYLFEVLKKIRQEKVTGFPIVPTMAATLLRMKDLSQFDFLSLRYLTNTAAVLPVDHIKRLQSIFPEVKIFSMYGLTECKRVAYLPPEDLESKPASVGKAMPNEEVYIVNEKGEQLNSGQIGELVVRGSNIMKGYWRDQKATEKVLKEGLFPGEKTLYTGDLFTMDEEGYLYFVSRKDDMIKSRGERISPKEIEDVLHQLKGVIEAAVIGVQDEILGQAIKAFILTEDENLKEREVIAFCMKHLEYFMVPKSIEFVKHFPRTSTGKIDKKILKKKTGLVS